MGKPVADFGLADEFDTEPLAALGPWDATCGPPAPTVQRADEPTERPAPATDSPSSQWWSELAHSPTGSRDRRRVPFALAAVALVATIGVAAWLLLRSSAAPEPPAGSAPASAPDAPSPAAVDARLRALLPRGYSPGACAASTAPAGAVAKAVCTRNADPGGPAAAKFTRVSEKASLRPVLDAVLRHSTIVTCPGNIQSPGPWRRNAAPRQISGTLVCSYRDGRAAITWTTEADLLVSDVEADQNGPALDRLYQWWSGHS